MHSVSPFLNKYVELEISGKPLPVKGKLIDLGGDILVVYNGTQYLYVPSVHIQHIKPIDKVDFDTDTLPTVPLENANEPISYRKILMNAKGLFVEIYITGNQSIHGYLTSIMNDFFVFYSPTVHHVFIAMRHVKYLIPYSTDATPYSLTREQFPLKPPNLTLARSFDQQLKKLEQQLVVLDLGENPMKIGLLRKVEEQSLELVTANGTPVHLHLEHVKTVHLP